MGIIGVVAALTLPNLNSSTGEKEKVAKVKKIYSNLNDAVGRAQAVYGPVDTWCVGYSGDCNSRYSNRISEFLKITNVSNVSSSSQKVNYRFGSTAYIPGFDWLTLSDGICVGILYPSIFVDIDGYNKGQFTSDIDFFVFSILSSGGVEPGDDPNSCLAGKKLIGHCAGWIIQNNNMDYLKAGNDGKCKNNTSIVLDGVSNITCK